MHTSEPFLDWLVLLSSTSDPPLVHSVSYADDEKDFVGNERYMDRVNVEFQKAAARGVSIMFAAGDDGMGSVDVRTGKQCTRGE
jgi:tripeptidyl-peptidase-1